MSIDFLIDIIFERRLEIEQKGKEGANFVGDGPRVPNLFTAVWFDLDQLRLS